jgi:hypothetical protein
MAVRAYDLDGDAILTVGIPGDNVLGILLGLGNDHLHFAPTIHARTAPAMTMEAVTWGKMTSQVGRRSGERSKFQAATALRSDSTETTECQADPDLDPAVADHCGHHYHTG